MVVTLTPIFLVLKVPFALLFVLLIGSGAHSYWGVLGIGRPFLFCFRIGG